jgi:FkbH-like protein
LAETELVASTTGNPLGYPFDGGTILRHAKRLRRERAEKDGLVPLRVAILGGWTTQETATLLEVFLLDQGFRPQIYQSEYNKFFEDAVLDSAALEAFQPQIVYLHVGVANLQNMPLLTASESQFDAALAAELARFEDVWSSLRSKLGCTIIQNNFELPLDPLGNHGASAYGGRRHFVSRLNLELVERARLDKRLVINDVCTLAARIGGDRWFDPNRWFAYKIWVTPDANAALAHSLAALMSAIGGRARKCLVLDLDNTLWGGVIGDDGVEKIRLGRETPEAEAFTAFQEFCLSLQTRGIILAICSKNDEAIARQGFSHPDRVLTLEHFSAFRANWAPKPENIESIAKELNIGLDSLVFVDDNPAEREIVRAQLPMVAVPEVGSDVSRFAEILVGAGYFETTGLSAEDLSRSSMYAAEAQRSQVQGKYSSYGEYLRDLNMKAEISSFSATYLDRITQLINKTNQFNLTTRRYTHGEVAACMSDEGTIALYGRLIDKFGDNGLVSVVIGRVKGGRVEIELWLMSCRVLKRDMERAMLDALVERAVAAGAGQLHGVYVRSEKNAMVADHYEQLGFDCLERSENGGRSIWVLSIGDHYEKRNRYIAVNGAPVS